MTEPTLPVWCSHVDGPAACVMFNNIVKGKQKPQQLSSDHDPLFKFHRWQANLRIREINEIKTIPYTPLSHPFIERLIGSIRKELLNQCFFWNSLDLQSKLDQYKDYFNTHRAHSALKSSTPAEKAGFSTKIHLNLQNYAWINFCKSLFQLPCAT